MKLRSVICWALCAFWFGVILACGSPQRTARGEPHAGAAEDMYHRCSRVIETQQCSGREDFICIRRIADGYYSLESYAERQQYLIHQGCPPLAAEMADAQASK